VCSVLGTPQQNNRLLLAVATARAMRQGLSLLGITALDRL
jgi:arginyl-tRNA synthetase